MSKKIDLNMVLADLGPKFAETAAELDRDNGFIGDNYEKLREQGVMTALIPEAYGGGGALYSEMCDFIRSLGAACPATALTLAMHTHLVSAAVANDQAGRPGRALLDKVVANNLILVSTGANDWLESNGSARRVEGGFEVTAFKPFASGSPKGNVAVTSVAYDDPSAGPQVLHFPLPLKSEGVEILDDWDTMGMRATGSRTIKIEKVFIPDAAVALKRPRNGYHPAFSVILTVALPVIMSAYLGVADAAVAIARKNAAKKRDDAVTQLQMGELENLLATAEIARDDMVRLANEFDFEPTVELAAKVLTRKTICANSVIAVCEKAMELTGGSAFYRKNGLERLLRDIHGSQFHPLPEKRQQMFCGRLSLGLPPVEAPVAMKHAAE